MKKLLPHCIFGGVSPVFYFIFVLFAHRHNRCRRDRASRAVVRFTTATRASECTLVIAEARDL